MLQEQLIEEIKQIPSEKIMTWLVTFDWVWRRKKHRLPATRGRLASPRAGCRFPRVFSNRCRPAWRIRSKAAKKTSDGKQYQARRARQIP